MAFITERIDLDNLLLGQGTQITSTDQIRNAVKKLNPKIEHFYKPNDSFTIFKKFTAVASGAHVYIQVKLFSKFLFVNNFVVTSNGNPIVVDILESPTVTDGTNVITARTINRDYSNDPDPICYDNPTAVSGGSKIREQIYFNQTATKFGSGTNNYLQNLVMKPGTSYVIDFLNSDTTASDIMFEMAFWDDNSSTPF